MKFLVTKINQELINQKIKVHQTQQFKRNQNLMLREKILESMFVIDVVMPLTKSASGHLKSNPFMLTTS